jgi:O-antigen/teichoic acid export membrane protein
VYFQVMGSAAPGGFRDESAGLSATGLAADPAQAAIAVGPSAPPPVEGSPSLRRNSVARLASELVVLASTLIAAALTARYLGPAGKGYYSSLMLLGGLFVLVFNAGLGEAAIVLAGRRRFGLDAAAAATLSAVCVLAVVGAATFFVAAEVVLPGDTAKEHLAIVLTSVLVAINVVYTTLLSLFLARERVVTVGLIAIANAVLTTAAVWVILGATDLDVAGAILASVAGGSGVVVASVPLLRRAGLLPRPRVIGGYLRAAIRYGTPLQLSNVLVLMTGRLDLILVYHLQDSAAAGRYSIALTIGMLVAAAPMALSFASFPRLANLPDDESRALTGRVVRTGVAAAIASAAVLAALTPLAVPLVFGDSFAGAVGPTLVLVGAGVLWSGQWLLARAAAARGVPGPLFRSFALSFVCMIALDFVLIGPMGETGAALASLIASTAGLAVAGAHYVRAGWTPRALLPARAEVVSAVATVREATRWLAASR